MEMLSIYEDFMEALRARDREKMEKSLIHLRTADIPQEFNWISDILEKRILSWGGTVMTWKDLDSKEEEEYTGSQIYGYANGILNTLRGEGIGKGDAVYLMASTIPEQWFVMIAAFKGGFSLVPNAVNLTARELKHRFSDFPPKAIIADRDSAERVEEALGALRVKKFMIRGRRDGWSTMELVKQSSEPERTSTRDVILHYFTSGTTGMPKRVMHTALSYPVGSLSTVSFIFPKPGEFHLNLSAPGWAKFAWSSFFTPLISGAKILGLNYKKFDPMRYLDEVETFGVYSLCAPPTAWRQFVIQTERMKFSKLEQVVSAGEPLNPEVIKSWRDMTGTVIRDFYGQTESTAMIGNYPNEDITPGSMGRPSPLYDIVVLGDDMREVSAPGVVGMIAVRLSKWRPVGLFAGYSDPNKNSESFVGSYYLTGDRGYFDERRRFYFVGRSDDVIKTSDYRVGPFEVESALLEHPSVAESAVIGIPDPIRYQLVKAFIVLKPGYEPSEQLAREIYETTRKILPPYKCPRVLEFVPELPKTVSGKIRRNVLRENERNRGKDMGRLEFRF